MSAALNIACDPGSLHARRSGNTMKQSSSPRARRMPLLAALVLAALAPAALAGPGLERIKQTGKIIIAHRESSVPFSYVLPDKKPVGYAVDLCLKIAEAVRKKLDLK